jgi:hypothetical protein
MKSVFAALLVITVFVAYSKRSADLPRSVGMEGTWQGDINTVPSGSGGRYQLRLYDDGKVERINNNGMVSASGNWEMNGRRFTATYNYSNGTIVIVNAIVEQDEGRLTGVWENNGNDSGQLSLTKK